MNLSMDLRIEDSSPFKRFDWNYILVILSIQVIGLINDIPTCEDLITRMVNEAKQTLADRLASFA